MNLRMVLALSTYIQGIITEGNILDRLHVRFVEMGKNVNITCNVARNPGNYQWYKEKEDGGLLAVSRGGCLHQNKDERYYIHCDNNNSVQAMEIRHVLRSDSGTYYCVLSGLDQTFHLTSTLIVTDVHPENPTLSILSSVEDHLRNSEIIPLLCVALNWTRDWDLIEWTLNDTRKEGWITLDPDGSLRSLFITSTSMQHDTISCYIKKTNTDKVISSNITLASVLDIIEGKQKIVDEMSTNDCYTVLYVGVPIIITIIIIHVIILVFRRRTLSKDTPPPETTHQEHHMRFSPQDESVTYAAVKS